MNPSEPIAIYVADIKIEEPLVALTDLLVSAFCFIFFYRLNKDKTGSRAIFYYKYYFLTMGIATTFGGLLGHAFLYAFSFAWKLPGWIISMFSIMLIERATIEHTRILFKPRIIRILGIINILELLTFLTLTIVFLDFFFVEFHSGYGLMFVVLSLEGYLYIRTKNAASKYILTGIGLAAVAALIFMNKLSPHPWFNHIALSHVFMAAAACFFYSGAKRIDLTQVREGAGANPAS